MKQLLNTSDYSWTCSRHGNSPPSENKFVIAILALILYNLLYSYFFIEFLDKYCTFLYWSYLESYFQDDDSDLDCELEALPPVSEESALEAAACVKVNWIY